VVRKTEKISKMTKIRLGHGSER